VLKFQYRAVVYQLIKNGADHGHVSQILAPVLMEVITNDRRSL
jgi:hypothetical protein